MTDMVSNKQGLPIFVLDCQEQRFAIRILSNLIRRELDPTYDEKMGLDHPPYLNCVHCKSSSLVKRGKDSKGRQRYQCRHCGKSSTCHSSGTLTSSKVPLQTWLLFVESHVRLDSLRKTASKCGISLPTAFGMRHKLLQLCATQLWRIQSTLTHRERIEPRPKICLHVASAPDKGPVFFVDRIACDNARTAVIRMGQVIAGYIRQRDEPGKLRHQGQVRDQAISPFIRRFKRVASRTRERYGIWYDWLIAAKLQVFACRFSAKILQLLVEDARRTRAATFELPLGAALDHWRAIFRRNLTLS